ncbi:S66 peptidase family protein [Roseimarinus sediminis]|uniref:S66 peptidase family protein n=1 Tax=Roseimarinus sediminis TaxID=1610899 RepID=UPI003D1ED28B
MKIPPYLQPGDQLALISPASKTDRETVEPAIALLQARGYPIVRGKHLYAVDHQFAGKDEDRRSDFQAMIDDPSIKAIICSRGGYGSLRTLKGINWSHFIDHPKWIVGFSDVTVIHSALQQMNIASVHAAMPRYFLENDKPTPGFEILMNTLEGKQVRYELQASEHNIGGKAEGMLVGGNLSILYSLRGTPYDIDTKGKILFIEDLSEYLYHLDRMMMNLKAGGKLAGLAALVVGSFTGMKDHESPFGKTWQEIILDAVAEYGFPVLFNFPAGHQPENYPLLLGANCKLTIQSDHVELVQ